MRNNLSSRKTWPNAKSKSIFSGQNTESTNPFLAEKSPAFGGQMDYFHVWSQSIERCAGSESKTLRERAMKEIENDSVRFASFGWEFWSFSTISLSLNSSRVRHRPKKKLRTKSGGKKSALEEEENRGWPWRGKQERSTRCSAGWRWTAGRTRWWRAEGTPWRWSRPSPTRARASGRRTGPPPWPPRPEPPRASASPSKTRKTTRNPLPLFPPNSKPDQLAKGTKAWLQISCWWGWLLFLQRRWRWRVHKRPPPVEAPSTSGTVLLLLMESKKILHLFF